MVQMREMAERTGIKINLHCILESGAGKGYADQTIAHAKYGVGAQIKSGVDVKGEHDRLLTTFIGGLRFHTRCAVFQTTTTTSKRCATRRHRGPSMGPCTPTARRSLCAISMGTASRP